jgi:hypothetical protein
VGLFLFAIFHIIYQKYKSAITSILRSIEVMEFLMLGYVGHYPIVFLAQILINNKITVRLLIIAAFV